jgi:hypothetical protein
MRLSLSPATLFLGASLPNHTKMFELVHLVTSMEDFGINSVSKLTQSVFQGMQVQVPARAEEACQNMNQQPNLRRSPRHHSRTPVA